MKAHILFIAILLFSQLAACGNRSNAPQRNTTEAASVTSTAAPEITPLPTDRLAAGEMIANLFVQQNFDGVAAYFDDTMKKALPVSQLKLAWVSLAQYGAFQDLGTPRSEKAEQYDVVFVPLNFEKGPLDLKVVFDPEGQIAGLFFTPAQGENTPAYTPPAYADPQKFTEQAVTVGSGEWALPGTLTMPTGNGNFPAVVLVHGSGPNDRDETIGPNKPFRDLAWGLATRGIAVLRYDKRTNAHAALFTEDVLQTLTVNEETVNDALLAVALLRQTPGINPQRVYVLGHSLGGMMLPRIGAADPQIAGLISLAGPVRPLEDLTLEQVTYLDNLNGTVSESEQNDLNTLATQVAAVKSPDLSVATPSSSLPLGIPANYWLDLRGYNPAETAKELNIPMLILQGGRDYQVTADDFELWKATLETRTNVQFYWYPDLNHLFMAGEGPASPNDYQTPGNVAEAVVAEIASWINPK